MDQVLPTAIDKGGGHPLVGKMTAGEAVLGLIVRLGRTADIARIARGTGHDFLFIDAQHSLIGIETIGHIAHAASALGVPALVRVSSVDDQAVEVLLDNGASGIVFPDVADAAAAERAVARVRFPPAGRRSLAGTYAQLDYRARPYDETVATLERMSMVVCMVETAHAIAQVEDIAAVPGVDVVHVGTHDLLADLGMPGAYHAPELREAYERTIAAARANGIQAGIGGNRDVDRQIEVIRMGARFITTQADIGFLTSAAATWTGAVRDGLLAGGG